MHEFGKQGGGERDHDFPFAAFFCDLEYDRGRWQQAGPSNISIFEESSRRVLVSESVPRGSQEKSERELHFEEVHSKRLWWIGRTERGDNPRTALPTGRRHSLLRNAAILIFSSRGRVWVRSVTKRTRSLAGIDAAILSGRNPEAFGNPAIGRSIKFPYSNNQTPPADDQPRPQSLLFIENGGEHIVGHEFN